MDKNEDKYFEDIRKFPCNLRYEILLKSYETILDDLKFFKSQQWKVAYYAMLLYATIFYLMEKKQGWEYYLLGLSFLLFIFSFCIIYQLHNSLKTTRQRKNMTIKAMDSSYQPLFTGKEYLSADPRQISLIKNYSDRFDEWSVTALLLFVIFIGQIVLIILILN